MVIKLINVAILLLAKSVFSQNKITDKNSHEEAEVELLEFSEQQSSNSQSNLKSVNDYLRIQPIQSWKFIDNPYPEINIYLWWHVEFAGDINGDGKNDLIFKRTGADERTATLSDYVAKTFVFYGGNTSALLYDQLFYLALTPVGDINGDGFDDAISFDESENREFYLGSPSGYTETGINAPGPKYNITQVSQLILP